VSEEGPGTIDPTATGEKAEGVPILERDETDTDGTITMETTDVTAWCPYEGTADYYGVTIAYRPEEYVVELTSLRDYFGSYREEAISHEDFAQRVFEHLTALIDPVWLRLVVNAPSRYGIETTIVHDTRGNDVREGDPADRSDASERREPTPE
jgi:7-cyano-7-deazaguanine reductase